MGFFGIGTGEILIILIIALIIVGPRKLPELAKILGKGFTEFKKAADDLKDAVSTEIHVTQEKQKVIEIQPHQPKNSPMKKDTAESNSTEAPVQKDSTETHTTEKPEEKGNPTKDEEEKKDLL